MTISKLMMVTNTSIALFIVVSVAPGFCQTTTLSKVQAYAQVLSQAQADLDHGHVSEARKKLEAGDQSLRSFEYDYLMARAQAGTPGSAAPDLIRTVKAPENVETRHGVLNEVDRQLA